MTEQKVYKFPTGATIPEGAVFLSTVVETAEQTVSKIGDDGSSSSTKVVSNVLVWHYFLVSV